MEFRRSWIVTLLVAALLAVLIWLRYAGFSADTAGGEHPNVESVCNDGIDNDADSLVDCDDSDCLSSPYCQESSTSGGGGYAGTNG